METLKKIDEQLFLYLNNLGSETWDTFWIYITDEWIAIPLYALLSFLVLWKTGFKSAVISGGMILLTVAVAYGISLLMKDGIMRLRPCNVYNIYSEIRFPLKEVGEGCGDFGFVSSHATVGMALITFMGLILKPYYKSILWPLFTWLALFCYSRVYVGKHYPSDLIVGVIIGLIVGLLAFQLRKKIAQRFGL
ncbi:MAG TPA: phosphatase PAP2 family protein [Brumimicrobium sp.]|nr:phosphatase PAP2 family protein [Brumimicrobium sp.]